MTTTDFEVVLDESLDFSVPCEYLICEWFYGQVNPAEWIIVMRAPECGCISNAPRLFCDPCKEGRLTRSGPVYCPECGSAYERTEHLISVERL